MKSKIYFLCLAVFINGCSTRVPLSALPEIKQQTVVVVDGSTTNLQLSFSTARGRSAQAAGATGGLIGILVGESVAASADSEGADLVRRLRSENGLFECKLLVDNVRSKLTQCGIDSPNEKEIGTKLNLKIQSVGLLELQRGFWVPFLHLKARLVPNYDGKIWDASVNSTGTQMRRLEEYKDNPKLYSSDFVEVARDAARQLVSGPIRR